MIIKIVNRIFIISIVNFVVDNELLRGWLFEKNVINWLER